jgi:hypothetical protein
MHYETHELINSIWNREEKTQQKRDLITVSILPEEDARGVVNTKAPPLLNTYNILSNILLSSLIPYTDEITVDHLS